MARNAINDFEIQHIVKILYYQLICMNSTGTSAELKVMTNQGQTLTIDVLDIYSLNQGSLF